MADCNYHGIELDSSFWLLWHIDRFNKSKPSPNLLIPNFLMKDLDKANIVSPYFTQLLLVAFLMFLYLSLVNKIFQS